MKILVADADASTRVVTVKALEQLGYECTATANGVAAWESFRAGRYDVVIADWMMPGIDGVELCRRIRHSGILRYTYFIILAALAQREFRLAGIRAGADDYLAKPLDRQELELRLIAAERVTNLYRRLEVQTAELERLNRELFDTGRRDALTGVANRRSMKEDIGVFESALRHDDRSVSVALFDIDRFKDYNDTYLHQAGDDALRRVATALATHLEPGEKFYRYGGEEFLAVMRRSLRQATARAEVMRAAVEACAIEHANVDGGVITVSAGVARLTLDGGRAPFIEAVRSADEALLRAKRAGRNRVVTAE